MLTKKKEPSIYEKSKGFYDRNVKVSMHEQHVDRINLVFKGPLVMQGPSK
jgi:hypothetical protein